MSLQLLLPDNHTALTGDLDVQLIGPPPPERSRLQLLRATAAHSFSAVAAVPVFNGSGYVRFPCGVVTLGGRYRVALLAEVGERAGCWRAECSCTQLQKTSASLSPCRMDRPTVWQRSWTCGGRPRTSLCSRNTPRRTRKFR